MRVAKHNTHTKSIVDECKVRHILFVIKLVPGEIVLKDALEPDQRRNRRGERSNRRRMDGNYTFTPLDRTLFDLPV